MTTIVTWLDLVSNQLNLTIKTNVWLTRASWDICTDQSCPRIRAFIKVVLLLEDRFSCTAIVDEPVAGVAVDFVACI